MANAKTAIKRLKNALDKKYEVSQPAPIAGAVGDGKLFINGQLYNGAVAGVTQVVNVGRPAAAQYAAKTGGGVIVQSGGGGSVSTGGGSGPDVTALSLLTVVGEAALTNDRYLDVSTALTKTDGGAGGALTIGLATPGGLTVSSTNVATGNHTHAIASSSAPGAAASILASSSAGLLTLPNFTATTGVRTPLIDTASGGLTISPANNTTTINGSVTMQRSGALVSASLFAVGDTGSIYPRLAMHRARNVLGSETGVVSGDILGAVSFRGYDGTAYPTAGNAEIRAVASENFTATAEGTNLRFFTTASGTVTLSERLRIHNSGNVSILNTTDNGFALDVTGTARASTSLTTPLLTTATNVDLVINPAGTGAVQFPNDQTLRTSTFDGWAIPYTTGFQINEFAPVPGGSASVLTIGRIQADELNVRVFVANETRVDRGDEFWTKSFGIVALGFTTPASIGGTVSVKFENSPALAGAIFANNDWLLIRKLEIDSGLSLFNVWGQVATYVNNGDGTQNWTFTLRGGPTSKLIEKGSLGIDFGQAGAGLIHLSVVDASGSPYIKLRKWVSGSDPMTINGPNFTTYVQLGHLGSTGNAFVTPAGFGLYARSTNDESRFILSDDNGLQIRGAAFKMYNSSLQTVDISATDGSVKLGTNIASSSTTGFEFNGATGALTIGNASYPGTVTVYGSITVTGGNAAKTDFSNITATIDNVPNGTSFHRTTPNQVTGAGRAFTALSSGNNLVTSVIPATAIGNPGTAGLYLGSDYMGYHTGSGTAAGWKTYMDSSGNMRLAGNASNNYIQWVAASNKLQGVGGGVEQWYADATDGKLYAGAGAVWLDTNGTNFNVQAAGATPSYLRFASGATLRGGIGFIYTAGPTPDPTDGMVFYNASSTKFRFTGAGSTEFSSTVNVTGSVTATVGMSVGGTAVSLDGHTHSYLPLSGGTLTGTLTSRAITPNADNTHDLGASGARWQDIYAVNLHVGTIVGTPSYSHSHAASDITSGTLDFARIPTTWTGALTLDADSAGTSNYVRWLTQTSTGKAWDLIGRAHDFATAAQQNDMLLTYYDGTTTHIVFQADNATRIVDFGQTPTVGGTAVSLSGHTQAYTTLTYSGLTAGHVLSASGATTAVFAQLAHSDLSGLTTGDPHTQYVKKAGDTMTGTLNVPTIGTASGNLALSPAADVYVSKSIGIGVTTAEALLHVETTSAATANFLILEGNRNIGDTEIGILFKDRAAVAGGQQVGRIYADRQASSGNFDLVFHGGSQANAGLSTEIMRLRGIDGKVGILQSAPAYTLDVTGTVRATGVIYANNDIEMTGELLAANGSAAAPSIAALSDTNTGLYWSAADTLAISTGGVLRASFNSAGATVVGALTVPTIDTASGNLTLTPAGGTVAVSAAITVGTTATITGVTSIASGSVGAPGLTFTGDTNTGLYRSGVDAYSLVAGGAAIINVGATGAGVNAAYDNTAALKVQSVANDDITLFLKQKSGQTARMWRVEDSAGQELIVLDSAGNLQSGNPGFYPGLRGWQIAPIGNAEFNNITARGELHASIFVMDEFHASGGTLYIAPAGKLELDATVYTTTGVENILDIRTTSGTGSGTQIDIRTTSGTGSGMQITSRWIENYFEITDPPSGHATILDEGDTIRCKALGNPGVGIDLYDIWGVIGRIEDMTDYYRYYYDRKSGGANGIVIPAGTAIISYGAEGDGRILLTADQNYAPYIDIFTSGAEPWNGDIIPHTRLGRLDGVGLPGVSGIEQYGMVTSTDLSDATAPYIINSNLQMFNYNVDSEWNNGNPTARITSGGEFRLGTDVDADSTTGLKFNPTTGALTIGSASYPGTVTVYGSITVTSGSGYAAFSDKPTSLSGINSGEGSKLNAGLDSSGSLITKVLPGSTVGTPGASGLFLGSDKMGYYNGSRWLTYMDSTGAFTFSSATSAKLAWDGTDLYGTDGSTVQWYARASTGKFYAGGGDVTLDNNGIKVKSTSSYAFKNALSFTNSSGNEEGRLFVANSAGQVNFNLDAVPYASTANRNAVINITATPIGTGTGQVNIAAQSSGGTISLTASAGISFTGNLAVTGDIDMNNYDIIDPNNVLCVRTTAW